MIRYMIAATLLVFCFIMVLPGEIWKWQVAQAERDIAEGKIKEAQDSLSVLSEQYPEQIEIQTARLLSLAVPETKDSFLAFNRELQKQFPSQLEKQLPDAPLLYAQFRGFSQLGMHREAYEVLAIANKQELEKLLTEDSEERWNLSRLNALAYHAYLADRDSEVWYDQMKKNLTIDSEVSYAIYLSEGLRLVGQPEKAADQLIKVLDNLETMYRENERQCQNEVRNWMGSRDWPTEEEPEKLEVLRNNLLQLRALMAWIGSQGWRVLEGTDNDPYRERFLAVKHKAQPIQLLATDLDPKRVIDNLINYTMYFDTRGCLAMQHDRKAAIADLDRCVLAVDLQRSLIQSVDYWESRPEVEIPQLKARKAETEQSWAAIYYHHLLLSRQLNDSLAVEHDTRQIQELGWEPGPALY